MSNRLYGRTPRGNASRTNPGQRGQQPQQRRNASAVINSRYLQEIENFKVDQDLSTVLKKTGGRMILSFGAEKFSGFEIQNARGAIIGDADDVRKIASINTFINGERKEAEKFELNGNTKKLLWALHQKSPLSIEEIEPRPLSEFKSISAPLINGTKTMAANLQALPKDRSDLKGLELMTHGFLSVMSVRIRNAVCEYLLARFESPTSDKKFNELLFERGVPIWVYHRLTSQKVDVGKTGISSFLFPKDPSKGFSLTVREIRDKTFLKKLRGMADASMIAIEFFNSDAALKSILGLHDEEFIVDEAGSTPFLTKYGSKSVLLIPSHFKSEYYVEEVVETFIRGGSSGFAWPQGRTDSVGDTLTFLGGVFKRAHFWGFPNVRLNGAILTDIFPEYKGFDRAGEIRDPVKHFSIWYEQGGKVSPRRTPPATVPLSNSWEVSERALAARLYALILGITLDNVEFMSHFLKILRLDANLEDHGHAREFRAIATIDCEDKVDNWSAILSAADLVDSSKPEIQETLSQKFIEKGRKERDSNVTRTARCGLSRESQLLISRLKSRKLLATRISDWLRNFLHEDVQGAVASLMDVRFDALFKGPMKEDRADFAGFMDFDEYNVEDTTSNTGVDAEDEGETLG